uniref:WH2 domain-containing protein n=1 Tax=Macrostomum lignano TaxID=282301 RepID=A0A1I8FQH2_9PLAT
INQIRPLPPPQPGRGRLGHLRVRSAFRRRSSGGSNDSRPSGPSPVRHRPSAQRPPRELPGPPAPLRSARSSGGNFSNKEADGCSAAAKLSIRSQPADRELPPVPQQQPPAASAAAAAGARHGPQPAEAAPAGLPAARHRPPAWLRPSRLLGYRSPRDPREPAEYPARSN